MKKMNQYFIAFLMVVLSLQIGIFFSQETGIGLFEDHGDIGDVLKSGSV